MTVGGVAIIFKEEGQEREGERAQYIDRFVYIVI